ncbi:MAG: DUF4040 domain-containing protein [Candidatus Anammoxibacter sp.]
MIDIILLLFIVVCSVAAIFLKDLLSAVIILGAFSFLMAVEWTVLNAVDVAFTEAAVGAGITSVLMLAALSRTGRYEVNPEEYSLAVAKRRRPLLSKIIPVFVVVITGAVLIYGTIDMPAFEDPNAPINKHVAPRYIHESYHEAGSKNMVTAILANYRGYDTLGETTVIFAAGICVILLLRRRR